uniref:Uncharacterized protein n=1 Tax=Setaria italica TaxID=4555 RepID=K3ZAZ8_SETIT
MAGDRFRLELLGQFYGPPLGPAGIGPPSVISVLISLILLFISLILLFDICYMVACCLGSQASPWRCTIVWAWRSLTKASFIVLFDSIQFHSKNKDKLLLKASTKTES